jgi:hypothetical protein
MRKGLFKQLQNKTARNEEPPALTKTMRRNSLSEHLGEPPDDAQRRATRKNKERNRKHYHKRRHRHHNHNHHHRSQKSVYEKQPSCDISTLRQGGSTSAKRRLPVSPRSINPFELISDEMNGKKTDRACQERHKQHKPFNSRHSSFPSAVTMIDLNVHYEYDDDDFDDDDDNDDDDDDDNDEQLPSYLPPVYHKIDGYYYLSHRQRQSCW